MSGVTPGWPRALKGAGFVLVFAVAVGAGVILLSSNVRRERPLWERYRAQLEHRGESLAWESFIPARVKNEDNFFEAPEMKGWFSYQVASSNTPFSFQLPPKTKTVPITLLDLESLPEEAEDDSSGSTSWPNSRQEVRQWVAQTESSFRVLSHACLRPAARLNTDYSSPMDRMDCVSFVHVRAAAQALATRVNLHWLDQQPVEAMEDLRVLRRVVDLSATTPSLVGGMIRIAAWGLFTKTISDGLQSGALGDADLLTIQQWTQSVNLLDFLTHSLRADRASAVRLLDKPDREIARIIYRSPTPQPSSPLRWERLRNWLDRVRLRSRLRVNGWVDRNLMLLAHSLQDTLDAVDSAHQRVHAQEVTLVSNQAMRELAKAPDNILASMLLPNYSKAALVAARQQTSLNQLQVACGLERYRRARGEYPERLEQLLPDFLGVLPRDLFVEAPLRYRRTPGGSYRLWSVGWNEQDDGGDPGPIDAKGNPTFSEGAADWVWPATPRVPGP